MHRPLFALFGVAVLLGAALGPAVAAGESADTDASSGNAPLAVSVAQDDGVTVAVTANGSGVENATVVVETTHGNESYAGTGSYETDENGTVGLPTPDDTVWASVTATEDDRTASTTAELRAGNASFGQRVSTLVQLLQTTNQGGIGPDLASWVVANNPGDAPAQAGPPAHAGPENDTEPGPPDHAGPASGDENETGGPPAYAGQPAGPGDGDDGDGPPAHAGPGGDDGDDAAPTPTETDADA